MRRPRLLALALCGCLLAAAAPAAELECGSLAVTLDEATGRITGARLPQLDRALGLTGGLRLTEGAEEREIALGDATFEAARAPRLLFQPEGEGLTVACTIRAEAGWLAWDVTLRNDADRQRLLALSLPVEVPADGPPACYDGYLEEPALEEPFDGPRYRTPIPLCAAWSEAGGAAVGTNPREHLSFIATRGEPLADAGARIETCTRIVLDPGQQLQVELLLCGMSGRWGRGEALHWWYASAPELFRPAGGIDPRVLRASGQYLAWKRNPLIQEDYAVRERARRCHVGWDWCIGPFKRVGDIVARKEWFDYDPALPERMDETDRLPWSEYRAQRRARFQTGERLGVAMLFYTPSQIWCEEQLAREHFEDAIVRDPSVSTRHPNGYVKRHEAVVRVFPHNTSWGEQSKRDLAEVSEQLGLYGFAFDTATGPAKYRGPGMDGLPERGWDEDGPFVREGVAIRRLMEHVHTLEHEDGTTVAVVANIRHSADYNCCMGADAALFEGEPWKGLRGREWALRDAIGTKPACWWEHYALDSLVDYENMTREEIAAAYQGMADFTAIESLHMGFWPTAAYSRGFESMTRRYLPRIEACIAAGWQPVTAAHSDDFTWITRYGSGLGTHIAVGNETAEPAEGTLALSREWLDAPLPVPTVALLAEIPIIGKLFRRPGALVFTAFDGGSLTTRVEPETLTVSGVSVPRRAAEVVAACAVLDLPAGSSATAQWTGDRVRRTLALTVEAPEDVAPCGGVRVPDGMRVAAARIDGEDVACREHRGTAFFADEGQRREYRVEMDLVSSIIEPAQEELLAVDFLFGDQPAGYVVILGEATEAEELAAERIVHYFQWFVASERGVEEPEPFPVVRGEIPRDDSLMIVIDLGGEAPGVRLPDARHLEVTAPDADGLERAVDELLHVLDAEYVAPPTFVWRRSTNEAGLIGEWLPDPVR